MALGKFDNVNTANIGKITSLPSANIGKVGGVLSNPYDSYTKLMLHMDGANGSTVFVDSTNIQTMSNSGSPQISTAQSKFGGSSGLFNGSGLTYVSSTSPSDYSFGTGDFTMDGWVYSTSQTPGMVGVWAIWGANGLNLYTKRSDKSNHVILQFYNGTSWTFLDTSGIHFPTGAWHHFAAVRYGNALLHFYDGSLISQGNVTGISFNNTGITVGSDGGSWGHTGYLDEWRLSKGIARWTTTFTPPTAPYSS